MSIVCVDFKTKYDGDTAEDWVLLAPRGESFQKCQTWHKVSTLDPENPNAKHLSAEMQEIMRARWAVIGPAYDAYKAGQDVPENGTPLAAWSGITPEQAKHLRGMGVRTVEDVAELRDSDVMSLPFPNRRKLPELAASFLGAKDKSDLARELQEARERMAAMEEMLAEKATEKKRGPGRPRKSESEAA